MKTNWPALRHGYLILAGMALATSPVLAQTQAPAGATATSAVISSVAITQAPERSAVRVEGEGRLDVHAGRMRNPDRLVLDFAGARLAVQKTVIPGISAPVRGVRIGQYRPDVARVVWTLPRRPLIRFHATVRLWLSTLKIRRRLLCGRFQALQL